MYKNQKRGRFFFQGRKEYQLSTTTFDGKFLIVSFSNSSTLLALSISIPTISPESSKSRLMPIDISSFSWPGLDREMLLGIQ